MAALALLVAFLSASQDIVIDAWRVEILPLDLQGPGAGMIQTGYRVAMLVSGAGALVIAARAAGSRPTPRWRRCWSWACSCSYSARNLVVGEGWSRCQDDRQHRGLDAVRHWFSTAVIGPFADFMRRPIWPVILIFILGYKLGEAMAA